MCVVLGKLLVRIEFNSMQQWKETSGIMAMSIWLAKQSYIVYPKVQSPAVPLHITHTVQSAMESHATINKTSHPRIIIVVTISLSIRC